MGDPKRHHYVSQMQLRRFADEQGKLYFFDKRIRTKGVQCSSPKNLFVENHLYRAIDAQGVKDVALETDLAALEAVGDQLIEKILLSARAGQTPNLTTQEKEIWDLFFYIQWKRVPDLHVNLGTLDGFENIVNKSVRDYEASVRPLTEDEKRKLFAPKTLSRLKQNARVLSLKDPGLGIRQLLGEKGLGIAVIPKPNKSFVIGSYPIVKLTFPGRTHFSDPSVEMWFPVASDVAVTPWLARGSEHLAEVKSDDDIRGINAAIFKQSTLIASGSRALIESLSNPR